MILIVYAGIELICFAFIALGFLPASLPDFKFQSTVTEYPVQVADIDSNWGTWHYTGNHRFKKKCFDITYSINSYGARDVEREKISTKQNRVVVLGDSFLEGYGVDSGQRVTNILEKLTGREFLNFACSDFGQTQAYLVYKNLASSFDHSTVLIELFPFNDFKDDNIQSPTINNAKRYKPYFVLKDSTYKLTYSSASVKESELNKESYFKTENTFTKKITRFAKSFSVTANTVSYFWHRKIAFSEKNSFSYYYQYSEDELQKFFFLIRQIKLLAKNKNIVLLVIPTQDDVSVYNKEMKSKLSTSLSEFCKAEDIKLLDLLPFISSQKTALYLDCDGHWNVEANWLVARYLKNQF